jgi:hypothetical protein
MSSAFGRTPSKGPFFSAGTINNAVYEVYEAGVIRTGSAVYDDGGIQMDSSGLFGINPITGFGAAAGGRRQIAAGGRARHCAVWVENSAWTR